MVYHSLRRVCVPELRMVTNHIMTYSRRCSKVLVYLQFPPSWVLGTIEARSNTDD